MPLATTCPNCRALFRLPDSLSGKKVKCQKCQAVFVVPGSDGTVTVPGNRVHGTSERGETAAPTGKSPPAPVEDGGPPPLPTATTAPVFEEEGYGLEQDAPERDRSSARKKGPRRPAEGGTSRNRSGAPKSKISGLALILLCGGGVLGCMVCSGAGLVGFIVYTFTKSEEVVFDRTGVFRTDAFLSPFQAVEQFDPQFGPKRRRIYLATLDAGKSYQIDLVSNDFDAFLHVLDEQNIVQARDDDSGGGLNARIVFRPQRSGAYRIYATTLNGVEMGQYTLTIRRF